MPFIDWHEDFSVGIPSLDEEHKKFLGFLNDIYDAIQLDRAVEALPEIMGGLDRYISAHIAHEERYMTETRYPAYESHKAEHDEMRKSLARLNAEARNGVSDSLANEILAFLKSWMMGHVLFTDKAYVAHFQACGIER